ncbi:PREDICTED: uncharacterized protein LOC107073042 [Polistes dominula]|uniref:Uncharacterized protein LOC107073042 n=1 Tax=Polistes dominula TaxID=743375 RepID=A0ABM1J8Z4_POLDO|nr:PREDICTED: uncharacterized protein LOC107073042 [Polistes dominula]
MMFTYSSMFIVFGLFLIIFFDTTSAKCNNIETCTCIVPDNEAKILINIIYKGKPEEKLPHTLYIDYCENIPEKINENELHCTKQNGSFCSNNFHTTKLTELGVVNQTDVQLVSGYNNISVSITYQNFVLRTTVSCCTKCTAQFISNNVTYHVPPMGTINPCKKQLPLATISIGSTLVILFFVFSGLYFIGGAITLRMLRGATGWEMLPNHEFWCDLPSLIRDGITFTFNCCRADSYERI